MLVGSIEVIFEKRYLGQTYSRVVGAFGKVWSCLGRMTGAQQCCSGFMLQSGIARFGFGLFEQSRECFGVFALFKQAFSLSKCLGVQSDSGTRGQ